MPTCPFCNATLADGAVKCVHCGEWVARMPAVIPGPPLLPPAPPPKPAEPAAHTRLDSPRWTGDHGTEFVWFFMSILVGAGFGGMFAQAGANHPPIAWATGVAAAFGVVLVAVLWSSQARGAETPSARVLLAAAPIAAAIFGFVALVVVGPAVRVWEEWHRVPPWGRVVFLAWVGFYAVGGVVLGVRRPDGQALVHRNRAADAALTSVLMGYIAFFVACVVVMIAFAVKDGPSRPPVETWDLAAVPRPVRVMMVVGAVCGLLCWWGVMGELRRKPTE